MTQLLSIASTPHAPVACDMTAAEDTLANRMSEYRRLFDHALLARESTDTSTTFRLAARPGVLGWVLDLVRREAACCPFLSHDVVEEGEEIRWTTSGGLGASEMTVLDAFFTGADTATVTSLSVARQMEHRSGIPVIVPTTERG